MPLWILGVAGAAVATFMWFQNKNPAFAKWVSRVRNFIYGLGFVLAAIGAVLLWVTPSLDPGFGTPVFVIGLVLVLGLAFLEHG